MSEPASVALDELRREGAAFLEAVEALLDWMNGNDLSADHEDQQPKDYARVCATLTSFRAAIAKAEKP